VGDVHDPNTDDGWFATERHSGSRTGAIRP
jgi:hypothetical protein